MDGPLILRSETGDEIPVAKPSVLVGRRSRCDIVIQDPRVSAHHCQILLDSDGHWYVKDLDSTNGTFVNGQRVSVERLNPGDELRIGKLHKYRIELEN